MPNENAKPKTFQLNAIGTVRASDKEQSYSLQIDEPYRAALKELDQFSHVQIFWWADRVDTEKDRKTKTVALPYAPEVEAGVFACRSEARPNPIAITSMAVLSVNVEKGIVVLPWIDAFDCTPVLDLKPYIPVADRIREFKVAKWLADWPEWMEDAEAYFAKHNVNLGECEE